jgi:hypothetical protein
MLIRPVAPADHAEWLRMRRNLGSDIHVMLALYSCFGQIVVANEILDGTDMIGKGLGKRQCTAYQT